MTKNWETIEVELKDKVAVIKVNNPPVNQLSGTLREEMKRAFKDVLDDKEIRAAVITGTGDNFIAGADIKEIKDIFDKNSMLKQVLEYDEFHNLIEDSKKPVVAAINGAALGGGLELAMACHYRLADEKVKLGQPEVQVGLIPGAGGTQRLPRLAGLPKAIEIITTGKSITAEEALKKGIINEIVPKPQLLNKATEVAKSLNSGSISNYPRKTRTMAEKLPSDKKKEDIISASINETQKKAKGFTAPLRAIEAMQKGLSEDFQADLRIEAEIFSECAVSKEAKNMIGIFLNTKSAGMLPKLKGVRPEKIQKVAMLGLGVMGAGIANLILRNGYQAVLWDVDEQSVEKGFESVRKTFSYPIKKGKMSESELNELIKNKSKLTTQIEDVADADVVIEAVIEDLSVKKKLWSRVNKVCKKNSVFATNTSALPINEIASSLDDPSRMLGLHFFNPADRMQLVEVVMGKQSSENTLSTVIDFSKRINKIPVIVNDGPGFYVSRQLNALMGECNFMLEEGDGRQL